MKKRIVSMILGSLTAASVFGAAANADKALLGGWTVESEDGLSKEDTEVFDKALEGLEGVVYEPVRLLAEQIAAGINYAFLCRVTPVVPDAEGRYCIAYIYEDTEGNAELIRVQEFVEEEEEPVTGGWSGTVGEETAEAAKEALEKAAETLTGADYEAEAVISAQVVAGMNYLILCKVTAVVPDDVVTYDLVTVYEDLDGNAEITDVTELEYSLDETTEYETEYETEFDTEHETEAE